MQAAQGPTKGTKTRHLIVDRALNIAAQEGLGALSIGRLAKDLNMSKSGLVLHFGSKANLELAVVERADLYFFDYIMVPIDEKGLKESSASGPFVTPGSTSWSNADCRAGIFSAELTFSARGKADPSQGGSDKQYTTGW